MLSVLLYPQQLLRLFFDPKKTTDRQINLGGHAVGIVFSGVFDGRLCFQVFPEFSKFIPEPAEFPLPPLCKHLCAQSHLHPFLFRQDLRLIPIGPAQPAPQPFGQSDPRA